MHSFDDNWEQLEFSIYLFALEKNNSTGRKVLCLTMDLAWQWIQVLAEYCFVF